jgi:alpha-tubulin suppressor-like RCC1 family protein
LSLKARVDGDILSNTYFQWRFDDVQDVAAGSHHIILLAKDGTALTEGQNMAWQLGDGTRTTRDRPKAVMTDIASVAAGDSTSLFVSSNVLFMLQVQCTGSQTLGKHIFMSQLPS